jgi:hypothetical protein
MLLGVCLDGHLVWKQYSDNLINKLSIVTFMLRKLQPIVSREVLRIFYFSHFQAQLNYGIIFWGSSSSMKRIFVAQKRALRVLLKLSPRNSCREGLKELGTLTAPCL